MHEVAGTFLDIGVGTSAVASALGSVFDASPDMVATALIAGGASLEEAVAAAFGPVVGEVGKAFTTIGAGFESFYHDAPDMVGGFVTNDLKDGLFMVERVTLSAVSDGAAEAVRVPGQVVDWVSKTFGF